MTRSRKSPSRALREELFLRSRGRCERCSTEIAIDTFHVSHLRAHRQGGPLVLENLGAWCAACNLTTGAADVADTRVVPREWQWRALERIVERIRRTQVATVAAAPGAGKTVFAGLVFEALCAIGYVDRMVVLAPRRTLVQQWHDSLLRCRHVELHPGGEVERRGQHGVVVTYQSLGVDTVDVHARQAELQRTLFVLDEVHHVGEPTETGMRPAWARHITELIGDVEEEGIHVAGILNLSGTLWRSKRSERISTVRYSQDDEQRLVSDVDFEITAVELIRDGHLRPVDLFRRSATVELVNLAEAQRIVSRVADLDQNAAGRAAIRGLPGDPTWRENFVEAVLERLELRHRDLGHGPAKALIVARSQADARMFQDTADRLMRQRGLRPIAELAISSEIDAQQVLERFRRHDRPGVLCTVDMAGEGYDCPEITVVGFASNKLTPLYVRQVVARAQRVTDYEREKIGHPIPAAVIIPDVPELVEVMSSILEPMRHELRDPIEEHDEHQDAMEVQRQLIGMETLGVPKFMLDAVNAHVEGDARVTGEAGGDVAMELVRLVEPEAVKVGLPESDAPRMVIAVRTALTGRREARPFDRLPEDQAELATALADPDVAVAPPAPARAPTVEPLSIERMATELQDELARLGRWWHINGDTPVANFNAEVNRAGNVGPGGRPSADVEQLRRSAEYARRVVARYCKAKGLKRPRAGGG